VRGDELAAAQREREWFHALRLPPGAWAVVRVDGRGFSRFTEKHFAKPFDDAVNRHMVAAATSLATEFEAPYACTHSDEISVLLPPAFGAFGRGLEKLVSVSAGTASAAFTASAGRAAVFDSRVWIGTTPQDVVDYFAWRQADAARSALGAWCYWTLRQAGRSPREATAALEGAGTAAQNELLHGHGVNFNDVPLWQRRGTGLYWRDYRKAGWNPRTGTQVTARRRELHVDAELPMRDEYRRLVERIVDGVR
jgi:tRNA(His) 5'-end guanylyltransferase